MDFLKWFRREKEEDKRKKELGKKLPEVKVDSLQKKYVISLKGLECAMIKTMYGITKLYYNKLGTRLLFLQTEIPLPKDEKIIPIIDSAKQVLGYYQVSTTRARGSNDPNKELYIFEKSVEWSEVSSRDKEHILEVAKRMNIDIALPVCKNETIGQNGGTVAVDTFKSSVENAVITYPYNDGRTLSDVIGKIVSISKYFRTNQIMLLNTADSKYLLVFGNYATIIDNIGMVVTDELPADTSKQMCVRITYNGKTKDVTVFPLRQ